MHPSFFLQQVGSDCQQFHELRGRLPVAVELLQGDNPFNFFIKRGLPLLVLILLFRPPLNCALFFVPSSVSLPFVLPIPLPVPNYLTLHQPFSLYFLVLDFHASLHLTQPILSLALILILIVHFPAQRFFLLHPSLLSFYI